MSSQSYRETKEREQIIAALDEAQAALVKAADGLRDIGARERTHKTLNIAQQAMGMKCILVQDWEIEDAPTAAAGEEERDAGHRAA